MVEAPFALLEIEMEVVAGDTIVAPQVALGLIPEVFYAVDMVSSISKTLPMVDTLMSKLGHVEHIVCRKAVGIDDGIRFDRSLHEGHQGFARCIRNDKRMHFPTAFEQAEDGYLASGPSAALAFAMPAEIALVNFDLASKEFRSLVGKMGRNQLAKLEIEKRGRVAVHPNQLRRCAGRSSGHEMANKCLPNNNWEAAPST